MVGGYHHDDRSGGGGYVGGDRGGYNTNINDYRGGGGGGRGSYNEPRGDFNGRGAGRGYNMGGRGPSQPPPRRRKAPPNVITFSSFEEERDWIEDRRRKRWARASKFDLKPSLDQLSAHGPAVVDPAAIAAAAVAAVYSDATALPQQTRHARRLYVGNLPPLINEHQIHRAFREAIQITLQPGNGIDLAEDPILSVYINHERRFCFLEFKTVEMCSACMALDGLEVMPGEPPVKVKRPNDYNPALAPPETNKPVLDLSKLGIISPTVLDGPNKIFIGGLHYHLQDSQVLELLHAFGKVKAFHLVKNEPDTALSKGYCFVEYVDPAVTPVAVAGLNNMDIGGGKSLTARLAGDRGGGCGGVVAPMLPPLAGALPPAAVPGVPAQDKTIVSGYDVEELVDAAMGKGPMPIAPTYFDSFGQPLTRIVPVFALPLGTRSSPMAGLVQPPLPALTETTRILVLLNMVTDDDLATEDDRQALVDEVREECSKYGVLNDVKIPRQAEHGVEVSAIRKVFLEYASQSDAANAEKELFGRQFGPNVVKTQYYSEIDFAAGRLR